MHSTTVLAFLLCCVRLSFQKCSINIRNDISKHNSPLFIDLETEAIIRTSDANGNIDLIADQDILLACPGISNSLTISPGDQEVNVTCVSGQTFAVNGVNYHFSKFACKNWPQSSYEKSGSCLDTKSLIEVGFKTTDYWIVLFRVCHDDAVYNTHYTEFNLVRDVAASQKGAGRSDWEHGPFFQGLNPTNQYKRVTQQSTISKLLGGNLGKKYISLTSDYFMSKGHMVAFADFTFNTQQQATMTYINAAPQWQTFNGKNWNDLETDVRGLVGRLNEDFIVYTGTFGQATLLNDNDVETNLFLAEYRNQEMMPVPKYYWKVIHSPTKKLSTAFVGINNPYMSLAECQMAAFCTDISETIPWLSWDRESVKKGYSFACDLTSFREIVKSLPDFETEGLLK